jgi:hypothetical protein
VEVRLWPTKVDNGVLEMLAQRFPQVKIIRGREDILAAFAGCEFLLHGFELTRRVLGSRWASGAFSSSQKSRRRAFIPTRVFGPEFRPSILAACRALLNCFDARFHRSGARLNAASAKKICPRAGEKMRRIHRRAQRAARSDPSAAIGPPAKH